MQITNTIIGVFLLHADKHAESEIDYCVLTVFLAVVCTILMLHDGGSDEGGGGNSIL